jgi:hypothetical protein
LPERLELTKNAQFYVSKNDITDSIIKEVLKTATDNKENNSGLVIDLFREVRVVQEEDLNYKCSIKVYPSIRPVYFINDELEDRIYAFIILIEYKNYLAVFKKSCSNITNLLNKHFNLINSTELSATFDDTEVEFQKLSLRNMTIAEKAMRARSYEAANLKGLLSTHSAGRSIPYYLKFRQGATIKTISGTGRIVESSQRETIDEIACWVKGQIESIENPSSNNSFLDSFAKKVELSEVLSICQPSAILIESNPLYERIEADNLPILYKSLSGRNIKISKRVISSLFSGLEQVYELDSELNVASRVGCSKIRKNIKTLTISSKILTKFRVIENGKELTLQKFIVKNGYYSITFSDPKFMYFMGSCFEDSSGISEINSILDVLQPQNEISSVTSEKGSFSNTSTNFDTDSMFGVIEKLHEDDDYIFCDDLGVEWADHITLNKEDSSISFIHSKHGDISSSASNLHEVVGQGIKNLGYMYFNKEQMLDRIKHSFSRTYNNNNVQTNINRIRKGDPDVAEIYLDDILKDYKLHRKCILSCSFLSKSAVETEFRKIQSGQNVRGNVIQLLWILSSFAHAVKDVNAIPIIYCNA